MNNSVAFSPNNTQTSTSLPTSSNVNNNSRSTLGTINGGASNNIMTNTSATATATANGTATTQRRRSSGLNSFLNTFGIRQNNNNNNANANNTYNNTNGNVPSSVANVENSSAVRFDPNESLNANSDFSSAQIQVPAQAHTLPHGQSFHHLPISISLTGHAEPSMLQPAQLQQRSSVSASTSPIGALDPISHAYSNTVSVHAPLADIDPNSPENHGTFTNNTTNANNATAPLQTPNTAVDNIASLKNLRHYIYSADQPNADELLNLDLARNGPFPETVDEETLQQRKDKHGLFSIRLTPFIDSSFSTNPGLSFDPVIRTAGPGSQLVIGRYTERVREAIAKIPEQYHPVVFKSKVVSRTHGCFKVDSQGNWYVRDVRSSSGTFLNHQRLSPASTLSKDTLIHDGDVLQLGMDFRGGTEEIYRCVKIRVEINRSWKRRANAFNKEALQRIRNLQMTMGLEEEDCSICLSKIKPCQAMFISPCSHSWHFQCIRRLVMTSYPQFVCPNCRCTCDLEASLENSDTESETESDGGQLVDELGVLLEDPKDINMG